MRRSPGTLWRVLGFACVVPACFLLPDHPYSAGGLPGLAGALLVATVLGGPLAAEEWRARSLDAQRLGAPGATWRVVGPAVAEWWSVLTCAAALAPLVTGAGPTAWGLVAVFWLGLGRWAARADAAVPPVARGLAVAAGVALLVALGANAGAVGPWTWLEPRPEAWRASLSTALLVGPLLTAGGLGSWSATAPAPGEADRRPHAVAGLATLGALAAVLTVAWRFEAGRHGLGDVGRVATAALVAAAAASVLARPGSAPGRVGLRLAGGALATWWFAGPGAAVLPLFWTAILPLGAAVAAYAGSLAGRLGAATAASLVVGAALAWPGVPERPLDAGLAAVTVVVGLWIAGTRAARALPPEAA